MILITGASSGIGEACARALAAKGHSLLLVARRKERLMKLTKELKTLLPSRSRAVIEWAQVDVSQWRSVEKFSKSHRALIGKVEVLINNAGLARGMDLIQDGDPIDWDEMIDTNIKGVLYMTHLCLPAMIKRKRGHIVQMGSVAGSVVYPKGNIYCATKFAVKALTRSMRADLLGTGVRISELSPGMVESEFSQVRLGDKLKAAKVYEGMRPLTPMDIAEALVWVLERPSHVSIEDMVLYPTDQASPTQVVRLQPPAKRK